jgi:hypothetical protein
MLLGQAGMLFGSKKARFLSFISPYFQQSTVWRAKIKVARAARINSLMKLISIRDSFRGP